MVTGVSAAAILKIRQAKAKFLDGWTEKEGDETTAENVLAKLAFLDFEQDEYTIEVTDDMIFLLSEVAVRCKGATIALEMIRSLKSMADSFNSKWNAEQVKRVCQVVLNVVKGGRHTRRSKPYQSGLAFLKDLSSYPSLRERRLTRDPFNAIKMLRGGRDETDTGEVPPSKRLRADSEQEEDGEDRYHQLMEELASCTDPQQAIDLHDQIDGMGYDSQVQ